jgi:hypothetical protein
MEDTPAIPGVTLEEIRPHAQVVIRWRGPDAVTARVHVKAQPARHDETHAWRIDPEDAKALWASLDRVRRETGAAGDLSLRWREEAPAPESPAQRELRERLHRVGHAEGAVALTALHVGQALAAAGRRDDAIAMYRFGISELGARHASVELLDDTGTKLILAEHRLAAGDADQAAALLERVLDSRATVYARRFTAH